MCGICGIVNFIEKNVDDSLIRTMMIALRHRGPNDDGVFLHNRVGLGFVRLSILDLSLLGHQPMSDETGRYTIIHNGEVYNYIEIREILKAEGLSFISNTDTEVILKAYMMWGEECLDKFNGMWAFAIYDKIANDLFIARDRYGVKPLYYYTNDLQFVFASEIRALYEIITEQLGYNKQAIFDYLVFNRTDQTTSTFYSKILRLDHGDCIKISNGRITFRKWYDLRQRVENSSGFENPEEYLELFKSSTALRLRSDVPVGVCLSGGLDSSSIVSAILTDSKVSNLKTFSAVYETGQYGDESEFINLFRSYRCDMFSITPTARSLFDDMKDFVFAIGEPVPSTSPYAQFKVMQLASETVTVTLDGQGADESLGGYHYFYGFFFKELLINKKFKKLLGEIKDYLVLQKSYYGLASLIFFLLSERIKTKTRLKEKGYLSDNFKVEYSDSNQVTGKLYASKTMKDALIDHFENKLEHLLKWEDRNSMHFSIESRVPFLDYRLVEKSIASAPDSCINNGYTKTILRNALKGILPEPIRLRKDKIGFGTPQSEWFREKFFIEFVKDTLRSTDKSMSEFINYKEFENRFDAHSKKKIDFSKEIWKFMNLVLWDKMNSKNSIA